MGYRSFVKTVRFGLAANLLILLTASKTAAQNTGFDTRCLRQMGMPADLLRLQHSHLPESISQTPSCDIT